MLSGGSSTAERADGEDLLIDRDQITKVADFILLSGKIANYLHNAYH